MCLVQIESLSWMGELIADDSRVADSRRAVIVTVYREEHELHVERSDGTPVAPLDFAAEARPRRTGSRRWADR
jgi:hypothetical protein